MILSRFLQQFGVRSDEIPNRGLAEACGKTSVQRNIILERILGPIAQFVPALLHNDIIEKSTNLSYIWQRIRKYHSFSQSEINFLKLSTIRRKADKRYETFYQRIVADRDSVCLAYANFYCSCGWGNQILCSRLWSHTCSGGHQTWLQVPQKTRTRMLSLSRTSKNLSKSSTEQELFLLEFNSK